jgi:ABC-type antimicrobial peptide transport system permease subunit
LWWISSTSRCRYWSASTAGPAPRTRSGSPPPAPDTLPSTGRPLPPRADWPPPGTPVSTTEIYVAQAQITAADTAILTIVEILGLVVVAIMLIGLVSALSMGVIERTREVGILRCVGARARHIRRVFSAEAMILTVAGWAFGVLLGWLIYQGLLTLLLHDAALSLPQEFPPVIPLIALAGVLALTLIVIRGPLRRATRIQPGSALRYQ